MPVTVQLSERFKYDQLELEKVIRSFGVEAIDLPIILVEETRHLGIEDDVFLLRLKYCETVFSYPCFKFVFKKLNGLNFLQMILEIKGN